MKIKNITLLLLTAVLFVLTSCSEDDLNPTSVFADSETGANAKNDFDKWLDDNYRKTYNIDFQYRYNDKLSDMRYNVAPADMEHSVALAILVKHMWIESYVELLGAEFIKTYVPRIIQLSGTYEYSTNGEIVMGTAEGGLKVMLYGVNDIDIDNPRVNTTNPYESKNLKPVDMNYWFFHTMHHEFCHILCQTKDYDPSFQTISASTYHATDWINLKDANVAPEGFVSAYASSEYNEDFAEIYATYITMSDEGWQKILDKAGEEGTAILNQKLKIIKDYFNVEWGMDLDEMRKIIVRRSSEVSALDLRTLK